MYSFALTLFAIAGGVEIQDCLRDGDACLQYAGFDGLVPKTDATQQGLDTFCVFMKNHIKCEGEFDILCEKIRRENTLDPILRYANSEAYNSWNSTVHEMCTEGTHLYQVIYGNIKCIRGVTTSSREFCDKRTEEFLDVYTDQRLRESQSNHEDLERKKRCLYLFVSWDCSTAALAHECGSTVGDAYLDMYYRGYETYECKGDMGRLSREVVSLKIRRDMKEHLLGTMNTFQY